MDGLLFWLTDAMQHSASAALGAALLWGVASVLLSPCHLGTIPLIVGFVGSTTAGQKSSRARAAALSFSFAGGMLLAIAIVGALIAAAGWAVGGLGRYTNYAIAVIFVLAGLHLIGILPMPDAGLSVSRFKRKGLLAAATLGLVFGIGLSPCTFAFVAPVLAAAFGSAASNPAFGALLLLAFGVGHCLVMGLAGTSAGFVQRWLDWNARSRGLTILKGVCGVLLLGSASLLVYTA